MLLCTSVPPPCTNFIVPRISTVTLLVYCFLRTEIYTFTDFVRVFDTFFCSVFVFGMFYEDNLLRKILCNKIVLWTAKYIGHVYLLHYPVLFLIRKYVVVVIADSISATEVLILNVVCTAILAWCCIKCESIFVWHKSAY